MSLRPHLTSLRADAARLKGLLAECELQLERLHQARLVETICGLGLRGASRASANDTEQLALANLQLLCGDPPSAQEVAPLLAGWRKFIDENSN